MRECFNCGAELDEDDVFCPECGQALNGSSQDRAGKAGAELGQGNPDFYFLQAMPVMFKSHNHSVLLYFVLNIFVIMSVCCLLFSTWGIPVGIIAYGFSLYIALSPLGEKILRWQTGCKPIKRPEYIRKLEPLFNEARARAILEARQEGLSIPDDIGFFMNDSEEPNAFATGRKTICVTKGLLNLPEDQIIAALCHEFGHIAHHDTDVILVITVGNMIVTAIITIIKIAAIIFGLMLNIVGMVGGQEGAAGRVAGSLAQIITVAFVGLVMKGWTAVGRVLVMNSMRKQEYRADEFAFNCGYGNSICAMLDSFGSSGTESTGLFAQLASSHPDNDSRIAALQNMGASYQAEV